MGVQLPVVAIVGRPNVGKSTLFNRLIRRRKAIVGDRPGVTVDRLESECRIGDRQTVLVDTGGIGESQHGEMQVAIDTQVEAALEIADLVLFVVDGAAGSTPVDASIADKLRRKGVPAVLVVNKAENPDVVADFYALGIAEPLPVSAIHGQGIKTLIRHIESQVPGKTTDAPETVEPLARIAVIGRPNVGKSTLINAWLKRDRMVVSPIAGTTRDAIDVDLAYKGDAVRLIDTAGQRKHGRISDVIEFVARVKAVQAFRRSDAAVMLLDGTEGIVEQDMRLMQLAFNEGCALIVAVNKLDMLSDDEWKYYTERLDFRMRGLPDVPVFRVAARHGTGVSRLLDEAVQAAGRNAFEAGTGELNRWLEKAQQLQRAPSDDGAAVRLKYISQTSTHPPMLKIFCNRPKSIKQSYRRYLEQSFRNTFNLPGVPIRFIFSASKNPYAPTGRG
ncbi:MAG: ribosome biogenesis GTPase Der [Mariprofundaceae bacterium]